MTALSASAARGCRGTPFVVSVPVKASAVIYKGGIVMVGSDGYAIPGADTASCLCFGVAMEDMTGGASDADVDVKVGFGAEWKFAATSITQAMLQTTRAMYIVDDNTIDDAAGATNDVYVGVLTEYISSTSGWVFVTGPCTYPTTGVTASAAEINKLTAVTGGTVSAALACVVDANKDLGDFRNLDCQNLDCGASGTAGTVDIFPTTAASGKLSITCADQAANHTDTLTQDSTAAARTHHLTDMGADGYIVETTAALSLAEADVLQSATAGAVVASKAVITSATNTVTGLRAPVTLAQATDTLTIEESGTTFICAVDAVLTLPAAAAGTKGCTYTIITGVASAGTGVLISPNASDAIHYVTSVDDKDLINSPGTDVEGDMVTLVCDGVDGWWVTAMIGTWAKQG